MGRNPIETVMGAVVLIIAGLFLAFAYSTADLRPAEGYRVSATFNKVGGLKSGADVRISGIKVGSVAELRLDPQTYQAVVTLVMLPTVSLPADTAASIASDGLLGGAFVNLDPGKAKDAVAPGGALSRTQSYQSVEDLVSDIIFLATKDDTKDGQ